MPVLDLGFASLCFAFIVSRPETVLGVDLFSESDDAQFPANLREFIGFHENAVR
jgi:hypothetical protein